MLRYTRCQGAIILDHHILLITHLERDTGRFYWVIPGGGLEPGETPEQCTRREMQEETGLEVQVMRLLLEEEEVRGNMEYRFLTYLCKILSGDPSPGYEPEPEANARYTISSVGWFDLRDPLTWDVHIHDNPFLYPRLQRIRKIMGYEQS